MAKIRRNWNKLPIDERITFGGKIIGNLKETPAPIPTPKPTIVEMDALLLAATNSQALIVELEDQLRSARAARIAAVDALMGGIDIEASTCESACSGDPALLMAMGWELVGAKEAAGPMPRVVNLNCASSDNDGAVDLNWDRIIGAGSYEYQTTNNPTDPAGWVTRGSVMQTRVTISGLASGQRIYVRVRAIGPLGPGAWSDEASKMVP